MRKPGPNRSILAYIRVNVGVARAVDQRHDEVVTSCNRPMTQSPVDAGTCDGRNASISPLREMKRFGFRKKAMNVTPSFVRAT